MALEIERKFIVDTNRLSLSGSGKRYRQGYLPAAGETSVRVRICNDAAWLTIKGQTTGASRLEFEYPIPVAQDNGTITIEFNSTNGRFHGIVVDGFIAPGHVCSVMGYAEYVPIVEEYGVPIVVTGFEPLDLFQGVHMLTRALEAGQPTAELAGKVRVAYCELRQALKPKAALPDYPLQPCEVTP